MNHAIKSAAKKLLPSWLVLQSLPAGAGRSVLLTFDDGPCREYTGQVLDILDEFSAKAIFFLVGARIPGNEDVVREVHLREHIVGNHTYSHDPTIYGSVTCLRNELARTGQIIEDVCGYKPRLFRPPLGYLNLNVLVACALERLPIVRWSLDAGETSNLKGESSETIAMSVLDRIKSRDIVLLHDDNRNIPSVLATILPKLADSGYSFYDPRSLSR